MPPAVLSRTLSLGMMSVLLLTGCGGPTTPAATSVSAPPTTTMLAPTLVPTVAPTTTPITAAGPTPIPTAAGDGNLRFEQIITRDGTTIEYAVATPDRFDPRRSYPVLLAMPPGGQDKQVTESLMRELWAAEGTRRGWIVISPVAPHGQLYFDGSEQYIPELLDATATSYQPEGGKYFLAGISNGGLSAFRIILNIPERFRALLVLPGFPYSTADKQKLGLLKDIPVAFYVGEDDSGWREESQSTYQALIDQGGVALIDVVPNEGHIIRSRTGRQLFDQLERFQKGS